MTQYEFTNSMARIIGVFGKANYHEERSKMIWRLAQDLNENDFEKIVDNFIATSKGAPLPQDFAKVIYAERKARYMTDLAEAELKRDPSDAKIDCELCFETGYVFTKEATIPSAILMRCTCQMGERAYAKEIPQWDPEIGGLFVRQPFPFKAFVPTDGEGQIPISVQNGKFVFSPKTLNVLERWRAKISFSEEFWRHQIKLHKGEV